jgi:hypothetical protein
MPLVSWATPAHVPDGYLLKPSLAECVRQWQWRPDFVVGDLGYLGQALKRAVRERWGVGVVTRLRSDMNLSAPLVTAERAECPQGQPLEWLGYEAADQLHWFGVRAAQPLCAWCWQAAECPRQFAYAPAQHETLLGLLPLNTLTAQRLLDQVRSWIEPAQSYEKNQLGLEQMFFNSLHLAWTMSLLADAIALLRLLAVLAQPAVADPMEYLRPTQMSLDLVR